MYSVLRSFSHFYSSGTEWRFFCFCVMRPRPFFIRTLSFNSHRTFRSHLNMRKVLAACLTMLASASAFQLCGNAVTGRFTALEPILRSSHSRSAVRCMQTESAGSSKGKLLVLGGTGFVGATVAKLALDRGYDVVSLSRRGQPSADSKLAGLTQVFLLAVIVRESLYSCGA